MSVPLASRKPRPAALFRALGAALVAVAAILPVDGCGEPAPPAPPAHS
jgi:hypothetical protein